jgi:deoxyuridine 5'-triphosphate nucleotidohydrolase
MDNFHEDAGGNLTPIFRFALTKGCEPFEFLPRRGTPQSTGWDVRSASEEPVVLRAGQYVKIPLGFRMFSPPGWWMEIRPRSSTFAKKQLHCLYGVIDEDYEGEMVFACQYIPDVSSLGKDVTINYGDAIGQIIPIRRQEMKVERVSNEEYDALCQERNHSRGSGGFGSTSK